MTQLTNQSSKQASFIKRTFIVIGSITAVVVFLSLSWLIRGVLMAAFAGLLLGVVLTGASRWVEEKAGLSYRWSLVVVVVLLGILILGFGALAGPRLLEEGVQLTVELQGAFDRLSERVSQQSWIQPMVDRLPNNPVSAISSNVFDSVSALFSRAAGMLTNVVVILFVGLYMAFEPNVYKRGLVHLIPQSRRERVAEVLDQVGYTLRWWMIGRLASMAVVGILSVIGLMILGVPLAFILGVFAGIAAFIPNIGPIIAVIPPALIALATSPQQALYVILLYFGIQMVESYLITPFIQRAVVSLPPAILILSQLGLGVLFGFIGVVLAAPLAAVIMVITKMLYVKDILGDRRISLPQKNLRPSASIRDLNHSSKRKNENSHPAQEA